MQKKLSAIIVTLTALGSGLWAERANIISFLNSGSSAPKPTQSTVTKTVGNLDIKTSDSTDINITQ